MDLSGKELVHTSYFDHSPILHLLALNVLWSSEKNMAHVPTQVTTELKSWFLAYKKHLADYAEHGISSDEGIPSKAYESRPLRRAA